jgi:hypothetical protein
LFSLCASLGTSARAQAQTDPSQIQLNKYIFTYISVLDPNIAEDVFGKRISDRFVVIQVTITNKNSDFQFLIHDVSLDLKKVFGKNVAYELAADAFDRSSCVTDCMARNAPETSATDQNRALSLETCRKACGNTPREDEPTLRFELSSLELSLIRGVAEKGQAQDKRNKLLRYLEGAGTVAAGFVGFAGPKYSDFIALYNGEFLAGYRHVYPDFTINQMNRLSDSAYKSNTLIPKEQAKVIVAFIPQAMFLTPTQRKNFRKDPTSLYPVSGALDQADKLDFRRAEALVDGNFVVELKNLPVVLTGVQINPDQALEWQKPNPVVKGYILGQFLEGANIALVNPPAGVQIAPDTTATPEEGKLFFVITANGPIPDTTPLSYKVFNKQNTQTISQAVSYTTPTPLLDSQQALEGVMAGPDVPFTLTGKNIIAATKLTITGDSGVTATYHVETAEDGTTSLVGKFNMTSAKEGSYSLGIKNGSLNSPVTTALKVKPKPVTP